MTNLSILDGQRIFKATNVKRPHQITLDLAESLSHIERLHFQAGIIDILSLVKVDSFERGITIGSSQAHCLAFSPLLYLTWN